MADQPLIECVPNFSEGRDQSVIEQITDSIEAVNEINLLDVNIGKDTNRTVVTFIGTPRGVVQAAYAGIHTASRLIDMRDHQGEHPRIGATDVCPLVPYQNISMLQTIGNAQRLARQVGEELHIPVYLYEEAAQYSYRRELSQIRSGEYEGLAEKMNDPDWLPDYGPSQFKPKTGATVIGARHFLLAYNINLSTTSKEKAQAIASKIRNQRENIDHLKNVRAIGWYMSEYDVAQVSLNIMKIEETPLPHVYESIKKFAQEEDVQVEGSELIGLTPLSVLKEAGQYFAGDNGLSDEELIEKAVQELGLDSLHSFDPKKKVIEYMTEDMLT